MDDTAKVKEKVAKVLRNGVEGEKVGIDGLACPRLTSNGEVLSRDIMGNDIFTSRHDNHIATPLPHFCFMTVEKHLLLKLHRKVLEVLDHAHKRILLFRNHIFVMVLCP